MTIKTVDQRENYRTGMLAAKGFKEDLRRRTWFNLKARKSLSHQAIRDYDEKSWRAPLSSIVPIGEFWFYSSGRLTIQVCEEQLALWGLETLRPVIQVPGQFVPDPMVVTNIDDPRYWEPLTDEQVIEKMQGGQAGSPIWKRAEGELNIRRFKHSQLEHEEEMAKRTASPRTPPALLPTQAIGVLRKLHEKGSGLLSNRPVEKNAAEAWAVTTREMLIKAFGSDSGNLGDFSAPAMYRIPEVDSEAGREAVRAEVLRDELSIVASCIEQLELISGDSVKAQRAAASRVGDRVFIGHGGDPTWRELKDFLVDRLGLNYDEFNREATAGIPTAERLQKMLDESAFALIVMTGEDEHRDGKRHARENVIHEIGLFQGHLGFRRAIVLLEDRCEEFSNIEGVTQIRFQKGHVSAKFEDVRRTLEREGLLPRFSAD